MNCEVLFKDPGDSCSLSIYVKTVSSDTWVLKAMELLLALGTEGGLLTSETLLVGGEGGAPGIDHFPIKTDRYPLVRKHLD